MLFISIYSFHICKDFMLFRHLIGNTGSLTWPWTGQRNL